MTIDNTQIESLTNSVNNHPQPLKLSKTLHGIRGEVAKAVQVENMQKEMTGMTIIVSDLQGTFSRLEGHLNAVSQMVSENSDRQQPGNVYCHETIIGHSCPAS